MFLSTANVQEDPLPITIETTEKLLREREKDFAIFLAAHGEGIRYFKSHRAEAIRVLEKQFGQSPELTKKTFDDYILCMDESLKVDFKQFDKLLAQSTQCRGEWTTT